MRYVNDRFIAPSHSANGVAFAHAEPERLGDFDVWRMDVLDNAVAVVGYDVPILSFGDESEELVERLGLSSERRVRGATRLGREIHREAASLDSRATWTSLSSRKALTRFIRDAAPVLPEPARLRAAIVPFLA